MGRAKDIIVKVIPAKIANEFVRKHHYSGKAGNTVLIAFGCFLDNILMGCMQFGNPMDKSKVISLVQPCLWNEMLELNRMAFDERLPKNAESRCLSIAIKLIKTNAPHIKWILSFADGCQCGDGTIYRASGFSLTQIRKNTTLLQLTNGLVFAKIGLSAHSAVLKKTVGYKEGEPISKFKERTGAREIEGFQLRYIYLIDKSCKITVPILPFSKIDDMGAGMYKGQKISMAERKAVALGKGSGVQPEIGSSNLTPPLQTETSNA